MRLRLGVLERQLPRRARSDLPLRDRLVSQDLADPARYLEHRRCHVPALFFTPADRDSYSGHVAAWDDVGRNSVREAEDLLRGRLRYFDHVQVET